MKTINRSALVPYSAAQMYELVKDVESYPDYLPWCSGSEVLEVLTDGVRARIDMSKGRLKQSFSTRNVFLRDQEITMQLEEGPFSQLQGAWKFESIGDAGSRISLYLEFDFSSSIARITIGPIFNSIADRMIDSFVNQANQKFSV